MTMPSPEAMIVICTVALIAYTAHVMDKAFAIDKLVDATFKMRERIIDLEVENAKLRESVVAYDSAIRRLCDQTQGHVDCDGCVLGKNYRDEDICALDELHDSIMGLGVEVD